MGVGVGVGVGIGVGIGVGVGVGVSDFYFFVTKSNSRGMIKIPSFFWEEFFCARKIYSTGFFLTGIIH